VISEAGVRAFRIFCPVSPNSAFCTRSTHCPTLSPGSRALEKKLVPLFAAIQSVPESSGSRFVIVVIGPRQEEASCAKSECDHAMPDIDSSPSDGHGER
jgi:hypothetical protein